MENTDKCFVIKKEDIDNTLKTSPVDGKKLLEPFKTLAKENNLPINILENSNVSNEAEVHTHEADLWLCLEGEVEFVYGGEMVNPRFKQNPDGSIDEREIKAGEIKNGTSVVLHPGDWLWIPAGQPHLHKCAGVSRLVIIKIPKK